MRSYARAYRSLGDTRDAITTGGFEFVYKGAVPTVRDFDAGCVVSMGTRVGETCVDWFKGTGRLSCGEALFEELDSTLDRCPGKVSQHIWHRQQVASSKSVRS